MKRFEELPAQPHEVGTLEVLLFGLDFQRYALPLAVVREVVRGVAITPLPGTPRVIEGIVDYRGTLVPVLDVRLRFGLPARRLSARDLLIVASAGTRLAALRCDANASVRRVDPGQLRAAGDGLARSAFVAGIATFPDGTVVIHDLASFLTEAESAELECALASESPRAVA